MLDAASPPITVAIPTYNGSRHLGEAIRSVRIQEGVAFDLLVCDDRSDDGTVAVAREQCGDRARIEVNSERLGLARNWNRCVELSRTPLVAVFHQDDVMRPGHLADHAAAFSEFDQLGMTFGPVEVIDDQGRPVPPSAIERPDLGPIDRVYPPSTFAAELAASNPVRCSSVTLRRRAHADVGGFDPTYRYAVDWEFWLRLSRHWAVAWRANPSVAVRWHPGSETQRFRRGSADLEEVERVLASLRTIDGPTIPEAHERRREADRRLSRAYLNRAHDALRAGDAALARRCLGRSIGLWRGILRTIARDPRLALALGTLGIAPGFAARWMARRSGRGG